MTKDLFHLISVGDRIRWLRERKGINQLQLAEMVGIKGPSVSNLETGSSKEPAASTLFKLAAVLDANPLWIMTGRGDPFDKHPFTDSDEAEVMATFKTLPDEKKAMVLAVLKTLK